MATVQTGYNPSRISELMTDIKESYDQIGTAISDGWPTVVDTMQREWIGADEQSLEEAFAKRMCNLYSGSGKIVNALLANLRNAGEAWNKFQQDNIMEGATNHSSSYNVGELKVTVNDNIIEYRQRDISDTDDRGLANGNASASAIQGAMDTYMSNIKSKISGLYESMNASDAFVGQTQSTSIKEYIETIGEGLGTVTTAAEDIYQALETLINANYGSAESNVSEEYNSSKAQGEIDSAIDSSMKWHA